MVHKEGLVIENELLINLGNAAFERKSAINEYERTVAALKSVGAVTMMEATIVKNGKNVLIERPMPLENSAYAKLQSKIDAINACTYRIEKLLPGLVTVGGLDAVREIRKTYEAIIAA